MPSWDAIRGNADVRYITNGKTSENRIPINKLYPIEYSQRKNNEVQLKSFDGRNFISNI